MDGKLEIILLIIIFSLGFIFLNIVSIIGKSIKYIRKNRKKLKPKWFTT